MMHCMHIFVDGNSDNLKCMENIKHNEEELRCGNDYPNAFESETIFRDDGYSKYNKRTTKEDFRSESMVYDTDTYTKYCDNRWIVSDNKHIMSNDGAHTVDQ